jgi:hypothetical protein
MAKKSLVPPPLPRPVRKKGVGGAEAREDRIMMRMHPDLVRMIDIRSRERGESRSRFVERLVVAFLKADPRNPKLDAVGRVDPDAPPPLSKAGEPMKFAERWTTFKRLNDELLGFRIQDEFLDDEAGHALWEEKSQRVDPCDE